jgi:4-hydroxy-tetrahydrodipicolinate synthase
MTSESRALTGIFSPVVTPFEDDGAPSTRRFVAHCRWLLRVGVGLAIFGTNSEANSLGLRERQALLEALIGEGVDPRRLMPGTGTCNVPDTVELTRHAVAAGCAGVLMLPPFYYKGVSDDGLFRYFSEVIERVADERLRIYLYHIPPVSQVPLGFALIERLLAAWPRTIAGIKDSSGEWENTAELIRRFQGPDFSVFAGSEVFLLRTLRAGGAGCITATGNVNPAAMVRLFSTWTADAAAADDQQAALDRTRAIFQARPVIPAMKRTLADATGDRAWANVRPPLVPLTDAQAAELASALAAEGFAISDAAELTSPAGR